jgi:hypothetical protein
LIIGICGLIGSGKDTVADYLVNVHGFRRESFAGTLKDAVAAVFGWDRILLEGRTKASREWREQVDPWWAERLSMPNLTPRWILQYWGTEVMRRGFHDDIWIASVKNKIRNSRDNIVISDCRFPNEISGIRSSGGVIVRTCRGPDPEWYQVAVDTNAGIEDSMKFRSDVHPSEWAWAGTYFDHELNNNGTMDDLYAQVDLIVKNPA